MNHSEDCSFVYQGHILNGFHKVYCQTHRNEFVVKEIPKEEIEYYINEGIIMKCSEKYFIVFSTLNEFLAEVN